MFRALFEYLIVSYAGGLAVVNHYFKQYEPLGTTIVQTAIILLLHPALGPSALCTPTVWCPRDEWVLGQTSGLLAFFHDAGYCNRSVPGLPLSSARKSTWPSQQHFALRALHGQYGPIIRTGSNEISVINADTAKSVLGTDGLPKGLDAFIPFSYGPANCVGKNLAKLEMMMVLTMLLQKFDFEFAQGFDWEESPHWKIDVSVTKSEPLNAVTRPRM
ncbi:hypothetical protein AAF712_002319 [Marasmius tenuissimus]|uniref:Cytochrome P450 n=1 Tax=Marasmius tenuissimus TaxID=585030 RepID=A0ABR3A943_9AGAR